MNSENNNSPWIQHKNEVNCQNCKSCVILLNTIRFKKAQNGYKYMTAKMRCTEGYWIGKYGDREKFIKYFSNNKWNPCQFLKQTADECKDFQMEEREQEYIDERVERLHKILGMNE